MNKQQFENAKFSYSFETKDGLNRIATNGNNKKEAISTLANHLKRALKHYTITKRSKRSDKVNFDTELDNGTVLVTLYNLI